MTNSDLFNTLLFLVSDTSFSMIKKVTDLQLGNVLAVNCINEYLHPGISVLWLDSNGRHYNNNTLTIPSLQPSHNNTNYTCVISIQGNPSGCKNQSRKYLIKEKRKT